MILYLNVQEFQLYFLFKMLDPRSKVCFPQFILFYGVLPYSLSYLTLSLCTWIHCIHANRTLLEPVVYSDPIEPC